MKLRTEDGLTLVEVLAVIIITSLAALLIFSVMTQSTKIFGQQSEENQSLNDVAYALKVMTKEIRKNPQSVSIIEPYQLTISNNSFNFDIENYRITKNDVTFIKDIKTFDISQNGTEISIKIINMDDKEFSTTLYLR
ncbi:PulJ/GspJ family protein [Metasolibacillus meyeri]|uniref:PulJ/GspJ family protein n=1 Tax=Metasolibacillus meyeri TaxID=1071052 RepID=UPI000D309AE8|nr:type II secretion system protein [Metasolibacillus meyeri]